jgi:hypothetical protein
MKCELKKFCLAEEEFFGDEVWQEAMTTRKQLGEHEFSLS